MFLHGIFATEGMFARAACPCVMFSYISACSDACLLSYHESMSTDTIQAVPASKLRWRWWEGIKEVGSVALLLVAWPVLMIAEARIQSRMEGE